MNRIGCSKEYKNFDRVNTMWLWIERYWYVVMPIWLICAIFLFFT